MAEPPEDWELALGGPTGVLKAAIVAIVTAGDESLTFGRGTVDKLRGFIIEPINPMFGPAWQAKFQVPQRPALQIGELIAKPGQQREEIGKLLEFTLPRSSEFPEWFERLAEELLNPTYVPGEPCRASTPLLKDLLDLALGRSEGGLNDAIKEVGATIEDLLFPAAGTVEELGRSVQAVLDDPLTAALNMILGQRGAIECGVDASIGWGIGVIETGAKKLEKELRELLS